MKPIFEGAYYKKTMLIAVFFYALCLIPFPSIAKVVYSAFILGSLPLFYIHRNKVFKDPVILILILAIAIQILSWLNSIFYYPGFASGAPKIDRLAKLFSFFLLAYWLKGSSKNVYILWGCLILGFFFGSIIHTPDFFMEITNGYAGRRVDFGIKNSQFTSMFSGIAFLITLFFMRQLYKSKLFLHSSNTLKVLSLSLLITVSFITVFLLITSQSRQVWLAIFITATLAPLFYLLSFKKSSKKTVFIGYLILSLSVLLVSQSDVIQQRSSGESGTFSSILSGDFDNIPMTSIGIRVNSWIEAASWVKKHPIIGTDSSSIAEVIQQSDKFSENLKGHFGHLHNYHIETLVAYGVIGLLIVYSLYYWVIRSLLISSRKNSNIEAFLFFSLVFVTFWFVVNFFETFNARRYGVYAQNIMLAGFYTFYLTDSLNREEK